MRKKERFRSIRSTLRVKLERRNTEPPQPSLTTPMRKSEKSSAKMKRILATILILSSSLALIRCAQAAATVYHIAKTGNDANSGVDLAHAWLTIQKCSNTAGSGDTCTIHSGTYAESVVAHAGI